MTHSDAERRALADALRQAGPDAPTLCEGWDARDLAAHLVAREHRPDTGPGAVLASAPLLSGWTERVRRRYARREFGALVDAFAAGPPLFSPFSLPGVDAAVNLVEHVVHTEDVRRAGPQWEPRQLAPDLEDAVWVALVRQARLALRSCPVGVVLVVPDGPRRQVRTGEQSVVLRGRPVELLLALLGRSDRARFEVHGPDEAVAAFRESVLA